MLLMIALCQKLLTLTGMPNSYFSISENVVSRLSKNHFLTVFFRALKTKFFFQEKGLCVQARKPFSIRLTAILLSPNFSANPRYTNSGDSFLKNKTPRGIKGGRGIDV